MAEQSNPGATYFVTGRACVSCVGGGSPGSHGCVSPDPLLVSSGSSVLFQMSLVIRGRCGVMITLLPHSKNVLGSIPAEDTVGTV